MAVDEHTPTINEEENEEEAFRLLYDLDEAEKLAVFEQWEKRFEASLKYMDTLYPSMIANYKKYCSVIEPIKDEQGNILDDRANLFIPYPYAIVESEMPRLAGRLPRARAFPKREVSEDRVKAIQDLIYYTLDRMNFIEVQTLWMRQHAIYGWSPLYYFWKVEEKEVLERQQMNVGQVDQAFPIRRVRKTVFDDFWCQVLDVFDCFLQPGVEHLEDGDWFMFREYFSAKDLRSMVKQGMIYEEVEGYLENNPHPRTGDEEAGRSDRDEIKGLRARDSDYAYGQYEMMWTLENNRVVMVLDRQIVAKVGDNPHPLQVKPIINCNLNPLVNEPIGVGTIEALGGLPDKLNALSNARLDNISLLINKVFLVNRTDQSIDLDNVRSSPGNIILCNDVERSIKALDMSDTTTSAEIEMRITKEDMQFVSGVSDYIVGTKTSAKLADTATGVSTIVRESNAKFALKLSAFESGSLRKLIEALHAYNMTYMSEEKRIHVLGPKGYEVRDIRIEDILCECDFIIEPGSSVPLDQMARREALTNLLSYMVQMPNIIRVDKFVKEVLDSFDIRNVEDMLISPTSELNPQEDVKLADSENMALGMEMEIPLAGNDGLHLGVHQTANVSDWSENAKGMLQGHIQQHQLHIQQVMQQQMMQAQQMMGGQNVPTAARPGPAGGQAPGQGPMGAPPGLPGMA